ncbi:MAG: protein kinase [Acidobacteria bacterium]|nr:protein kinase [Acidobacteriota bacterium]
MVRRRKALPGHGANLLRDEYRQWAAPQDIAESFRCRYRKNFLQPGHMFFNRYEVVKRIGGGGMGNVYQTRDIRLSNRLCAIKELIDLYSEPLEHERTIKEFEREASLLATLNHTSIPQIYDYFMDSDKYYLVMEFIDGMDMNRYMKQYGEKLDEEQLIRLAIQICDVLHYLHTHKPPVIYRDLKPSNIMLTPQDRVVLVDFGIARFLTANLTDITTIGTMGYVPPEVYEEIIEPASDIYSLGATMFYFLTGVSPQTKPILIFDFSKNPLPREYNSDISPAMEQVICRCVSYNASNRFSSAYALKKELEAIQQKYYPDAEADTRRKDLLTVLADKKRHTGKKEVVPSVQDETRNETFTDFDQLRREFEEEFKDFLPPMDDFIRRESSSNLDIYCVKCYTQLSENDLICPNCGTEQPHSPFIKVPKAVLKLTTENKSFNVIKDITIIGRRDPERRCFPEIDLTPYDDGKHVSRLHARILKLNEEYYIEDIKSKNKIVVNKKYLLQSGVTHKLNSGDELRIGRLIFHFHKE